MKKTIIICASLVIMASMVLVGVIVYKNNSKNVDSGKGKAVMTYEQFTKGLRTDLSNEVKEEIDKIYDEYKAAEDDQTRKIILTRFYQMDVFYAKDKTTTDKTNYDQKGK